MHSLTSNEIAQKINQDFGIEIFEDLLQVSIKKNGQKVRLFDDSKTSQEYIYTNRSIPIMYNYSSNESYNSITAYSKAYNIDYKTAFKELAIKFNLFQETSPKPKAKRKRVLPKFKAQSPREHYSKKELLSIEYKDFTTKELEFWAKKISFDDIHTLKKILEKNNVKSLKSFQEKGKKEYKNLEFVFCFEGVKLYTPFKNYWFNGKRKSYFLPTYSNTKAQSPNYQYAFGLNTLEQDKNIILTEGEADCMALKLRGYNAITLGGVGNFPNDYTIEKLPQNKIDAILFDTDFAGIKNGLDFAKRLNAKQLVLPKFWLQIANEKENISKELPQEFKHRFIEHKPNDNDICDYIQEFGFDIDLENELQKAKISEIEYQIDKITGFKVEKYLSEKTTSIVRHIRQSPNITAFEGGTGIGKGHAMLNNIAKEFDGLAMAVPTLMIASQMSREYNLPFAYESNQVTQFENAKAHAVGSTYDQFHKVASNKELLVIDEAHLLSKDFLFRTKAINSVQRQIIEARRDNQKVALVSATHNKRLLKSLGIDAIKINREVEPINRVVTPYRFKSKNSIDALINHIYKQDFEQNKIVVKTTLKNMPIIKKQLVKRGILKENEIDFVRSEKREIDKSKTQISIEKNGLIPEDVKLVLATNYIETGLNIYNESIKVIYPLSHNHKEQPSDFIQFTGRMRKMKTLHIDLLLPEWKSENHNLEQKEIELNQRIELALEAKRKGYNLTLNTKLKHNNNISINPEYLTLELSDGTYTRNHAYFAHYMTNLESENLSSESYLQEIRDLGIEVLEERKLTEVKKDAISKKVRAEISEEKEAAAHKFSEAYKKEKQELIQHFGEQFRNKKLAERHGYNTEIKASKDFVEDAQEAEVLEDFLGKASTLESLGIESNELQANLIEENNSPQDFNKVINTIKNHDLLSYPDDGFENLEHGKSLKYQKRALQYLQAGLEQLKNGNDGIDVNTTYFENNETKADAKAKKQAEKVGAKEKELIAFKETIKEKIKKSKRKTELSETDRKRIEAKETRLKKEKEKLITAKAKQIEWKAKINQKKKQAKESVSKEFLFQFINLYLKNNGIKFESLTFGMMQSIFEIKAVIIEGKTAYKLGERLSYEQSLTHIGFSELEAKEYAKSKKELFKEEIAQNALTVAVANKLYENERGLQFFSNNIYTKKNVEQYQNYFVQRNDCPF